MFQRILKVIVLFTVTLGFSQNDQRWQSYFSYNHITDISESSNALYASTENAFFSRNLSSLDVKTVTSVDGLKAETITALYHSDTFKKTFIGNQNGLLLVVNQDGTILFKTGILNDIPVTPTLKRINHILEYDNKLYLSCDYGISVFDLTAMEFGNTYYMGPQGTYISVQQTCISNGFIYAATKGNSSGSGIRKADLSNQFLEDYNQWVDQTGFEWNGITILGNQIIALRTDGKLFKSNGGAFTEFFQLPEAGVDIRTNNDTLIVTTPHHAYVFNPALQQLVHIQSSQVNSTTPVTFTCATVIDEIVYIGTNEKGILSANISSLANFEILKPDGPEKNKIFRLKKSSAALWALYGKYDIYYNPYDPPNGLGQFPISKFSTDKGWSFIPYANLLGAVSLSNIAFNPKNENQFYVSSYHSGLLKVENETPTFLYDQTNTGSNGLESVKLPPPDQNYISVRINGPAYDKNGDLWMTNNSVKAPIKVLRSNGQWQSYSLTAGEPLTDTSYGIPVIDKNGTKWLPTNIIGLVGFNEKYNNKIIPIKMGSSGNLPSNDVRCLAVDNKNQLWIGTGIGLRIIPSVDSFITETEIQTKQIIILENDLAQELFYEQFIIDIAVDGANRKWVAIADSGVYLVSPNGQETIYHFTKENSPLPSNNINDIEIDNVTGEVFFATDNGLVSFKATATKASENLSNVYVYPNPVRPEYDGTVKISGLSNKAVVKITDIEGNLVYETTSEGGTVEWDTTAFGRYRVASGVYVVLVTAQDGEDATVNKVMIIR